MARLLHTSDWHLGHTLRDHPQEAEQRQWIAYFLDQIAMLRPDGVLICGDVFDTSNPSAAATRLWRTFLASVPQRAPGTKVIYIGGNHDSGARLDADSALLGPHGATVVGALRDESHEEEDPLARLVIPVGDVGVIAVPFLRPGDLPPSTIPSAAEADMGDGPDLLVEGVTAVYAQAIQAAKARLGEGVPLVAMGHLYMRGGQLSEWSERKVLGGNQHALPLEVFPTDLAYVALGHLHRPQAVGGRERVRYSGAPLPLAMDERRYPHQFVQIDVDAASYRHSRGAEGVTLTPHRIPTFRPLLRCPDVGALSLEALPEALGALQAGLTPHPPMKPYLEVVVSADAPYSEIQEQVEALLADAPVRLIALTHLARGSQQALGDDEALADLKAMLPEEVFRRKWRRDHDGDPPDEVQSAFLNLLEWVQHEEGR